jgi:hypothetical protein
MFLAGTQYTFVGKARDPYRSFQLVVYFLSLISLLSRNEIYYFYENIISA